MIVLFLLTGSSIIPEVCEANAGFSEGKTVGFVEKQRTMVLKEFYDEKITPNLFITTITAYFF